MNYYIYGYTSKGDVRSENEDRILIDGKIRNEGSRYSIVSAPFITAVCDGVGGEKAGELAAQTCLEELAKVQYRSDVDIKSEVYDIHKKVKKSGVIGQGTLNMQTTLCALAVDEKGEGMCINVGDSRMYRYVNAAIRQISTDQSYRQYIYEHGSDGEVSRIDPKLQNAIVSSIGSLTNDPEIEIIPLVTRLGKEPDDMIIIVSDGISDFVSEQQLEIGMGLDLPIGQKLEAIAQLAVDNGGVDNISIIGIKPYITKQELDALTTEEKGKTVNIQKLIAETDELGDILTFDINEILSKPKQENMQADTPIKEETEMETADEQINEIQAEPLDIEAITQEAVMAVEMSAETTAQTIREIEQQEELEQQELAEQEQIAEESVDQEETKAAELTASEEDQEQQTDEIRLETEQERELPDELVETKSIADEFKVDFSRFKDNVENITTSEEDQQDGEKKQLDFSFHTVELSHQSASSLARLEKLFGKK